MRAKSESIIHSVRDKYKYVFKPFGSSKVNYEVSNYGMEHSIIRCHLVNIKYAVALGYDFNHLKYP